jgi:hypothetical protein
MKLCSYQDLSDREDYTFPHVLVCRGTQIELINVDRHCRIFCEDRFYAGAMYSDGNGYWNQRFYFLLKKEAVFCKLKTYV